MIDFKAKMKQPPTPTPKRAMGMDLSPTGSALVTLEQTEPKGPVTVVAMTLLNRGSSKNKKPDDANLKGFSTANLAYVGAAVGYELSTRKPGIVCLEDYSGGHGPQAIHLPFIGEVGGVAKLWMHQTQVRWYELAASTLKKFVTGSGAGKKEQMWLGAYKRWGVDATVLGDDNNVLDAYCLARAGLALLWHEEDPSTMTKTDAVALKPIRVGGSPRLKKPKAKKGIDE